MGDQRGKPVVVAEPDLVGGHGVVLVDDRDGVQRAQPVQGALGVGVLYPHRDVVRCQQHLADGAVVAGERRAPRVHQRHLPDAGSSLLGGQIGGTLGQPQRLDPGRDRARRHDHHVGACLHPALQSLPPTPPACSRRTHRTGVVSAVVPTLMTTLRAVRTASRCAERTDPAPFGLVTTHRRDVAALAGRPCARQRQRGPSAPTARQCRGRST